MKSKAISARFRSDSMIKIFVIMNLILVWLLLVDEVSGRLLKLYQILYWYFKNRNK